MRIRDVYVGSLRGYRESKPADIDDGLGIRSSRRLSMYWTCGFSCISAFLGTIRKVQMRRLFPWE